MRCIFTKGEQLEEGIISHRKKTKGGHRDIPPLPIPSARDKCFSGGPRSSFVLAPSDWEVLYVLHARKSRAHIHTFLFFFFQACKEIHVPLFTHMTRM